MGRVLIRLEGNDAARRLTDRCLDGRFRMMTMTMEQK